MARAIDVARYLIFLAANEEEPDCLSHLRLQKLLYYVQGWFLAQRGGPIFPEAIEAWAHGPVVRAVYPEFASYSWDLIPVHEGDVPEVLEQGERDFITAVWEAYKGYSATHLRTMTHRETPWIEARRGYAPGERCSVEISQESMRLFFSSQAAA